MWPRLAAFGAYFKEGDELETPINEIKDIDPGLVAEMLAQGKQLIVTYSQKTIGVIVVLIIAYIMFRWVSRLSLVALRRSKIDPLLHNYINSIIKMAILVFTFVACLGIFGIETTSFAAVIGATGLAIGLAMQGSLSHLAAGFMLLIFRPFKVGDLIKVQDRLGVVDKISIFSTTIDTYDKRRIIIPNGSVHGSVIENLTYHGVRRTEVDVTVHQSNSIDKTRAVLEAAAASVRKEFDSELLRDSAFDPMIILDSIANPYVTWKVRVWAVANQYLDVSEASIVAIKRSLDENGIEIYTPKMDVNLSQKS